MENTIILNQQLLNCSTELEEAILLTAATLQPEKIFLMEHQGDGNQRHLVIIISEYEQRTLAGIIQSQDLEELFEMVSCCSNDLQETLSDSSVEDKRLFKILLDANKVYNSHTFFNAADIGQLVDKIVHLQEVAENTFKDWLGRHEFHFDLNKI